MTPSQSPRDFLPLTPRPKINKENIQKKKQEHMSLAQSPRDVWLTPRPKSIKKKTGAHKPYAIAT
jgi:hypothetical protein